MASLKETHGSPPVGEGGGVCRVFEKTGKCVGSLRQRGAHKVLFPCRLIKCEKYSSSIYRDCREMIRVGASPVCGVFYNFQDAENGFEGLRGR